MITLSHAFREQKSAERAAMLCEIRAAGLRRAADSISLDSTFAEIAEIKRGLVTEREETIEANYELRRAPCCIASLRLQGWGEVPVTAFGATPSEALAAALHTLADMLDVRAGDAMRRSRRWVDQIETMTESEAA